MKALYNKILKILPVIILVFGLASCRSHKKSSTEDGVLVETPNHGHHSHNKIGEKVAKESLTWIGTPYKYGASDKGKGTDCSGLVMVVYLQVADIKLPRNSAKQAEFCKEIKEKDVQAGDLVFFATGKDASKVSHVGVMIDNKKFVHASSSKGVMVSEMTSPYFRRTFIKYGRVPQ